MTIKPANQTIVLLPEGAALLPDHDRSLVVADLHLGKSAAFRAAGVPVPEGDAERDLTRLARLCRLHEAKRLVVAGDLFHSAAGLTPEIDQSLQSFISDTRIPVTLVRGNHDIHLGNRPDRLSATTRLELGGLHIVHDPADVVDPAFHLAGHLHPAVRVAEGGRYRSLRLPCFLLRGNVLVLPAFGGFTGRAVVSPQRGDRFYLPFERRVMEVPAQLIAR